MVNLIGSEWLKGRGTRFTSINPANTAELWRGREADATMVEDAVKAARAAFYTWSETALEARVAVVTDFRDILEKNQSALADLIAAEVGKVRWDALGEATAMINKIAISLKAYEERTGATVKDMGAMRSRLSHKPHGVMAVFGPYNFPGHLPNGHIVPAIIAGNTVVFKPSEFTPAVADFTARCWQQAGLPDGVLNLVQGGRDTGVALSEAVDINGILFTGSVATGQVLARQMVARPEVILALEMGGNNALIVDGVADKRAAAVITINSAYISSGQRCTCARRLIVPTGEEGDGFIEELTRAVTAITVGAAGDDPEAFMGPVISAAAATAVLDHQKNLIDVGAKAIVKAERLSRGAAFLSAGLLDVTAVENRPDEEIFGPLLQVIRVKDFDAAIVEANATRFGLAAGLLSDDKGKYQRFYERVRAGIVNWNQQLTGAASTAPFGGVGLSGNHRPSAYYAADYCAYPVASVENTSDKVVIDAMPTGLKY